MRVIFPEPKLTFLNTLFCHKSSLVDISAALWLNHQYGCRMVHYVAQSSRISSTVPSHGLSSHVAGACRPHGGGSSPTGTAVGCWRPEDAILRYGQVLHPGHLCHSSSAGAGHLGMAGLQMLHTDTGHMHPERQRWEGIRLLTHYSTYWCWVSDQESSHQMQTCVWFLSVVNCDLLHSDGKSRTAGHYSGAPSTRVRGHVFEGCV